jgi:hypothetical protein
MILRLILLLAACVSALGVETLQEADVCIYGGTASGICAGLAASRRGQSVIIVEPFRHLGGMHGGGIRIQQDCLYLNDIGGIAKELHNADLALPGGGSANQWQARLMIQKKVEAAGIRYFTEHRLDAKTDVVKDGTRISMIHLNYAPVMEEGVPAPQPAKRRVFSVKAKVFIDASYEGDLMAFAGCDYVLGRESKAQYDESLGGQRGLRYFDVDPYVEPGNPASGVLPMITTEPYEPGAASKYMIAYNFRLQWVGEGGTLIKPLGREVDRKRYELVIRALAKRSRLYVHWPDSNYARASLISSAPPARQLDYPDGDWSMRSAIWRDWIDHVKTMNVLVGLEHPQLRSGEYPDNNDFPDQLYTRMGRRMVGEYVMTQYDLMHQTKLNDSIGLAYYAVDIYPPRLIAHDGKVASEGEIFMRVSPGPYQISYRALLPKREKVSNLIVPVCMSASHVAMASIRMESSYVVMGEAAGIAASHAMKSGKLVHEIDVEALRADMKKAGVITEWNGTGYGPRSKRHWSGNAVYWKINPDDYKKIPIRLDPSWATETSDDEDFLASREAWNAVKRGWEWLYDAIDLNKDGKVSPAEYQALQDYKQKDKNWATTLKTKPLAEVLQLNRQSK